MTLEETGDLLVMLGGMYPNLGDKLGPDSVPGYHIMLADVPKAVVMARMPVILAKHATFPPTAPELRNAVVDAVSELPSAEEAWAEVMRQIKNRWPREGPDPETDPMILRAIRAIGWDTLTLCEIENLGYERTAFVRFYTAFRDKALERHNLEEIGFTGELPVIEAGIAEREGWPTQALATTENGLVPIGAIEPGSGGGS